MLSSTELHALAKQKNNGSAIYKLVNGITKKMSFGMELTMGTYALSECVNIISLFYFHGV